MGWARGSHLYDELISALIEADVSDPQRKIIHERMVEAFTEFDWDTIDECLEKDIMFDEVIREKYPEWFEEDEED